LHVTVLISLGVVFWEIFHEAEPFGDQPNLNSDPRYFMMVCCNPLCFLSKICSELIKKLENQQIALKASSSSSAPFYAFRSFDCFFQFDPRLCESAMVDLFESMTVLFPHRRFRPLPHVAFRRSNPISAPRHLRFRAQC
jgi:hypothetical protein